MADAAFDEAMIRRAIRLAMNGRGRVEPNPMVGCVLVKDGRVIGEGWHEQFGGPHAEPNALANCAESPEGATAYVTLEPCCHTRKKTPPCTPRLVAAKVKRVVLGCTDPNPDVDGKGIELLGSAGIEVTTGVMENECRQLLAPFIGRTRYARPYVTLKWAQTADGRVAGAHRQRLQISNSLSTGIVHELRALSDAILVGSQTVLMDDPDLRARGVEYARPLIRAVVDRNLITSRGTRLVQTARESPVIVYHVRGDNSELQSRGVQTVRVGEQDSRDRLSLHEVVKDLAARGVSHLLVEPGPTLARGFFQDGTVDRLWVIRSPKVVNDEAAPAAVAVPENYIATGELRLGGDTLTEYLNPRSPLYFAAEPSTDLVLAQEKFARVAGT